MVLLSEREKMNRPGTILFHTRAHFFSVITDKEAWRGKAIENNLDIIYLEFFERYDNSIPLYVFGDIFSIILPSFSSLDSLSKKLTKLHLWVGSPNDLEVIVDLKSALDDYLSEISVLASQMSTSRKDAIHGAIRELSIFSHYQIYQESLPITNAEFLNYDKYAKVYHSLKIPNK